MVYTDPLNNFTPSPHINSNLLNQYNGSKAARFLGDSVPIGVGFAFTFNGLAAPVEGSDHSIFANYSSYSRLSIDNSYYQLMPDEINVDDYFWYNSSGWYNSSETITNGTNLTSPEFEPKGWNSPAGKHPFPYKTCKDTKGAWAEYSTPYGYDLAHVALADYSTALLYLTENRTVAMSIDWLMPHSHSPSVGQFQTPIAVGQFQTPIAIPFHHFGATSCGQNETAVCIYYQYNGTAIAELEYDRFQEQWTGPSYILF